MCIYTYIYPLYRYLTCPYISIFMPIYFSIIYKGKLNTHMAMTCHPHLSPVVHGSEPLSYFEALLFLVSMVHR